MPGPSRTALLESMLALAEQREQRIQTADSLRQTARHFAANHDYAAAQRVCRQILAEFPADAETWCALAEELARQQLWDDAFPAVLRALELDPRCVRYHRSFGAMRAASGNHSHDRAYCAATGLPPQDEINESVVAGCSPAQRAHLLAALGRLPDAAAIYRQLTAEQPQDPAVWKGLGELLQALGEQDEARRAEAFAAYYAGEVQAAAEFLRRVLAQEHDNPELYRMLADCHARLLDFEQAGRVCEEGIAACGSIEPLQVALLQYIGRRGDVSQARDRARAAALHFPHNAYLKFFASLQLPVAYRSVEELEFFASRYSEDLQRLEAELPLPDAAAAFEALMRWNNFYLPYQGRDVTADQARFGRLACRIAAAKYPEFASAPPRRRSAKGKIRIGYLSRFFRFHSVGNLAIGWLRGGHQRDFETFTYFVGNAEDAMSAKFRAASDHYLFCPNLPFEQLCRKIREDELDILVFPDVGMSSSTAALAALQLAPVQCLSWMHPVTSGFASLQYFLSGDLMEPAGGEQHYCERLVRLPNLGVAYPHPGVPMTAAARGDFAIAGNRTVFLSCQSVYKYLPQHDYLFPAIAQRVPDSLLVFVETGIPEADAIFRQRLKAVFAQAGLDHARCCLHLATMDYVSYRRLIAVSDVFLDTLAWSGGNTTMEAVASKVPVVTLPGEFMRGRHSFAILRMLGLDECIAHDEADYVHIASELGCRADLRESVRSAMQARMDVVFEDAAAVRGLHEFFQTAAVAEASA